MGRRISYKPVWSIALANDAVSDKSWEAIKDDLSVAGCRDGASFTEGVIFKRMPEGLEACLRHLTVKRNIVLTSNAVIKALGDDYSLYHSRMRRIDTPEDIQFVVCVLMSLIMNNR